MAADRAHEGSDLAVQWVYQTARVANQHHRRLRLKPQDARQGGLRIHAQQQFIDEHRAERGSFPQPGIGPHHVIGADHVRAHFPQQLLGFAGGTEGRPDQ